MKSTANFYSLNKSQNLHLSVCFLARKLYKTGRKIVIIDVDDNLEKIDKLLWTFEQNSFLPHKIYKSDTCFDTPIILVPATYPDKQSILDKYDSIINIYEKPVIDKIDDKSIYEFVENIENRKEISRKKYTLYKNNNFVLNHKEFNEQTI
ncbi:MAG: DNA polymerase III subunit chi [Gammaproteobacteria bacterium]